MFSIDFLLSCIGDSYSELKTNHLFLACLEDANETKLTVGGEEKQRKPSQIISLGASNARSLLLHTRPIVSTVFRGVGINQYLPVRERLVSLLDQLIFECQES